MFAQQEISTVAQFHSKLKQVMLDYGAKRGEPLTQRELQTMTGLSLTTINRWHRDDNIKSIDPTVLSRLMDKLGCTFDELVQIEPDEPSKA